MLLHIPFNRCTDVTAPILPDIGGKLHFSWTVFSFKWFASFHQQLRAHTTSLAVQIHLAAIRSRTVAKKAHKHGADCLIVHVLSFPFLHHHHNNGINQ
jgi:hypothetical protein